MFYITELNDMVWIPLRTERRITEVLKRLREKYVGNVLGDSSICILLTGEVSVVEYKVVDEFLVADARFTVLLFKFFRGEIVHSRILVQDEGGMTLGIPFFNRLHVGRRNLPAVSERVEVSEGKILWVWMYKGSKFHFWEEEEVRLRVVGVDKKALLVSCDLRETGLGPLCWWE